MPHSSASAARPVSPPRAHIERAHIEDEDTELDMEEPAARFDELGVSSARPAKPRHAPAPAAPTAEDAPDPDGAAPAHEGTVGQHLDGASPLWVGTDPDAVLYLLEALWGALGAQSVALLRHDDDDDVYRVDALISRASALSITPFPARGNLLHQVPPDRSISLLEDEALAALQYHTEPESAVSSGAALALDAPQARVLLVADGVPEQEPFSAHHLDLLGEYADLLSRLFSEASLHEDAPSATGGEAPETDEPERAERESSSSSDEVAWPPVRPRSAILAEEMEAARTEERPLAFALVVPQNVEALAAGSAEAVAEAETQLFGRLYRVDGTARVERFGELLAGVFCYAGPAFVEAWAGRVAASGDPIHVGVAMLRARHADAEALRADAAAALREAYERGEVCVILE
jgi:hypothetical protein